MLVHLRPALVLLLTFFVVCGIAYPLLVTGVAQIAAPRQANGSLLRVGGSIVGSELVGQGFTRDGYFHSRPSAAGSDGYDALASGGSNLGPLSAKLVDRVRADVARLGLVAPLPADAVTASASGLDPHVSPANALAQVARIAQARGRSTEELRRLVDRFTESAELGILSERRVNVLKLNLALDGTAPR